MPVNDVVPPEGVALLLQRLDRIEETLAALVARQAVKEWYSTDEVSKHLGRAEFTVREWCRLGRVRAKRRAAGAASTSRGSSPTRSCSAVPAGGALAPQSTGLNFGGGCRVRRLGSF